MSLRSGHGGSAFSFQPIEALEARRLLHGNHLDEPSGFFPGGPLPTEWCYIDPNTLEEVCCEFLAGLSSDLIVSATSQMGITGVPPAPDPTRGSQFVHHMHFGVPGLGDLFKAETESDTISTAVALLMTHPHGEENIGGAPAGYVHEFYPLGA